MPDATSTRHGRAQSHQGRPAGDSAGGALVSMHRRRDAAIIAQLQAQVEEQTATIRHQAQSLAHSAKIFERASAAARIGVWECRLADEALTWTDVVYDIFDIPRGAALDRGLTLQCYGLDSMARLQAMRSRAIAERTGFHLDAEITTAKGNHRWIRVTATVESEDGVAVRIFGMKQDITEEKLLSDRTRYLAEFDTMTGLANRSVFQERLAAMGAGGALLLIDLDGFKQVNDTYGHAAGDICLGEVARRLRDVCRRSEFVARIGGDEFGVLVQSDIDADGLAVLAGRIVEAVARPIERSDVRLAVGASIGIARVAGCAPAEVFMRADAALYAAKAAGRNTFRMSGSGA